MVRKLLSLMCETGLLLVVVFGSLVFAQSPEDVSPPKKANTEKVTILDNHTGFFVNLQKNNTVFPYNSYESAQIFFPPYYSESDRIGFGKTSSDDTSVFDAGWYVDWAAAVNPSHPGGVEYARTIYFQVSTPRHNCAPPPYGAPDPATEMSQVTANYTGTTLINNVLANPGALWLIGNEFDARYNGSPIQAELYAELYHYFYTTIKAADPTAMVAIGGVSQPSPLRMKYLEKILNHYRTKYGEKFPTDLWNIHFYYMNELYERTDGGDEECEWGAGLPPFTTPEERSLAWSITVPEFEQGVPLNLQKLESNLRDFRQWMKTQGYQSTPLIITEHGMLATPNFGGPYTNENAAQYLRDIFHLFRTTTDVNTGYPADNYRLAQMWSWFSTKTDGFGGNLFDDYGNLSVIGQAFRDETTNSFHPYADMQLAAVNDSHTDTQIDVEAFAQNRGNASATNVETSVSLMDMQSGEVVGEKRITWGAIPHRYSMEPISLAHSWKITDTQLPSVQYELKISVSSDNDVNASNNMVTSQFEWSPVVNMVVSDTVFSVGNPFKFVEPMTLTITSTIVNKGNLTSTATTADIVANGSELLRDDVVIPALPPFGKYQITATRYFTNSSPFRVNVKLNSVGANDLEPEKTQLETILLYERVYLPLVMR